VRELTVRKRKFDGSVKYEWPGEVVSTGRDEWLTVYHHPRRSQKRMADGTHESGEPAHFIHYVGMAAPLTLIFAYSLEGVFLDAKCDAALPGELRGEYLDFVDLDLDVVVLPGGHHYVRDQDVFAERSVSMGYSDEAKRAAHLGVLHALRMVRRRGFPFDGHADALIQGILATAGLPRA
jgi:protein associated with RNAse G/E